MTTRLILVRHGQSMANMTGEFRSGTETPLTPLGEQQAEAAADYIEKTYRLDAAVASPLSRAFRTAGAIAARQGLTVRPEPDLREIDGGDFEGVMASWLVEHDPDYWFFRRDIGHVRCPNGETFSEMATRVNARLDALAREFAGKTLLVGIHATPIRSVQARLRGYPLGRVKDIPWVLNASLTILDYDENFRPAMTLEGYADYLGDLSRPVLANF